MINVRTYYILSLHAFYSHYLISIEKSIGFLCSLQHCNQANAMNVNCAAVFVQIVDRYGIWSIQYIFALRQIRLIPGLAAGSTAHIYTYLHLSTHIYSLGHNKYNIQYLPAAKIINIINVCCGYSEAVSACRRDEWREEKCVRFFSRKRKNKIFFFGLLLVIALPLPKL